MWRPRISTNNHANFSLVIEMEEEGLSEVLVSFVSTSIQRTLFHLGDLYGWSVTIVIIIIIPIKTMMIASVIKCP